MEFRIKKLRDMLSEHHLDGILVTKPESRLYLSGFTGTSGMLYVTHTQALLITDFRYIEQAGAQAPHFEIVKHGMPAINTLRDVLLGSEAKRVAFEGNYVTVQQYHEFTENIKDIEWVALSIDRLRRVKDDKEIAHLSKAIAIADEAFSHILTYLRPGIKERDVALELEFYMKRQGAKDNAFDFIVASGDRSAMPHGVASDKILQLGEPITLDFGCTYNYYHSDITRTVALGTVKPEIREIYRVVSLAQKAALEAVRPGLKGCEVDKIARDIIASHGYGEYFGHGLGHGVGLAIHEEPRLAPTDDTVLEPGMVVTVEPGIYMPNLGGVRIEDVVLVTTSGCEIITRSSKEFIKL